MRHALLLAALLATALGAASAQDTTRQPAQTPTAEALARVLDSTEPAADTAEAPAKPGFHLDLSSLPALAPNDYQLFLDPMYSTTAQLGLYGDYPGSARIGSYPPTVLALPTAIRWDIGPDAGFNVALFSLRPKKWDDLNTWEKIGWVTTRASALAGLAVMLGKLF